MAKIATSEIETQRRTPKSLRCVPRRSLPGIYRLPAAELLRDAGAVCDVYGCAAACARVGRVVFAAYDERAGAAGSVLDLGTIPEFNHRIEINGGLLASDASASCWRLFLRRVAEAAAQSTDAISMSSGAGLGSSSNGVSLSVSQRMML